MARLFARRRVDTEVRQSAPAMSGRGVSLPFGLDLGSDGIGLVGVRLVRGQAVITYARWESIPNLLDARNWTDSVKRGSEFIAQSFTEMRATLGYHDRERRCVMAIPGNDVVSRKIEPPKKLSHNELTGLAHVKAEGLVKYSAAERSIGVDPLSDGQVLISITRKSLVNARAQFARALGLRPIAVDSDWCAWQRAVAADAVLDLRDKNMPLLSVFGQQIHGHVEPGVTYSVPSAASDEQLAIRVGNAFLELRRDRGFDIQTVAIATSAQRFESVQNALTAIEGIAIIPVCIGGSEHPAWALAYGLAQWKLADYGVAA